jgi:hypothetical protein
MMNDGMIPLHWPCASSNSPPRHTHSQTAPASGWLSRPRLLAQRGLQLPDLVVGVTHFSMLLFAFSLAKLSIRSCSRLKNTFCVHPSPPRNCPASCLIWILHSRPIGAFFTLLGSKSQSSLFTFKTQLLIRYKITVPEDISERSNPL